MEYIFFKGDIVSYVWNYLSNAAGIIGPWIQMKQTIKNGEMYNGILDRKLSFKLFLISFYGLFKKGGILYCMEVFILLVR